ncbi:HepT-like ribonuclease domain-containing protein [Geoalkalibacter halelectricus]|uniref:DUF86 domain-containing protein n=1 Tax=Geoalkalibacter halelectricus TaxID=2847045 RepID=A0ABY5ZL01_9BACT|nr:HepT-like ribonuclease domain-containing protein [Geoalkalibacter halelectricus]MDO3377818.1 DUF86 domain-containing protein [Geoalkalibacter halelectricus]UWZ78590.1 DUF86 domain-containing protein [Geoalkalibacter halelectricus]
MTDEKRDQIYIRHMPECIERIERYATDTDKKRFLKDTLVQDATLRVLQVMAESSQRLSAEAKESHPEIDWRGISGFRNILVHDYLGGIDLDLRAGTKISDSALRWTATH